MERRRFIKNIGVGSAGLISLTSGKWSDARKKVTILHTNDTHSHIDPFPLNHSKYPGQGGVERRKQLIDLIREEEKNVLLLDAGDIFQGTPFFNVHGGEIELKLMSVMGYDAATMGNHDFDGGIDGFLKALPHANFPFLCANYDFSQTVLADQTKPYQIFKKSGIKIGVFGLGVELDGLVSPELYQETRYLDPIKNGQMWASFLRHEEGCQLVICLSHLGYEPRLNTVCDKVLATETSEIDLIIGGHSHTFMERAEIWKNKVGKPVLINQVGWAGLMLGRVDFEFNSKNEVDSFSMLNPIANYRRV